MEDNDYELHNNRSLLFRIIERPFYLIWWIIADLLPNLTGNCEYLFFVCINLILIPYVCLYFC